MTSTLVRTVRTPCRAAEPVTLLDKLAAREAELTQINELVERVWLDGQDAQVEALRSTYDLALRRFRNAAQRVEAAEFELAVLTGLGADGAKIDKLTGKLYGEPVKIKRYAIGALAYLDGPQLVPCKVTGARYGEIQIKVTAKCGEYAKGDLVAARPHKVIPRRRVTSGKIQRGWIWAQD